MEFRNFFSHSKKCLNSFQKFQPELFKFANECWNNKVINYDEKILLKKYLIKIPSISLDYAIMEFEKDISFSPPTFSLKPSPLITNGT